MLAAALLAAIGSAPPPLSPPPPLPGYLDEMHAYFDAEVSGAQLFLAAGGLALGAAGLAIASDSDVLRGTAGPLAAVALAEVGIGALVWWRTGDQVAALEHSFADDPLALRASEASRMRGVNGFLRLVKAVEVALLACGLGVAIGGGLGEQPVATGVGLGLLAQATTMLTLDMFAADRGLRYEQAVLRLPTAR